jgi:hypothetical protein
MSVVVIPSEIQDIVEEFIEAHAKLKDLESRVKKLRTVIEPYMKTNSIEELIGIAQSGKILLGTMDRPHITSQYTYYNTPEIVQLISPEARIKCLVTLIDKEALEALAVLKEVPEEVLNFRILTTISRLSVQHKC